MNRKQINKIVANTSKRRLKFVAIVTIIVTLLMLAVFCFLTSIHQQKDYYIHYDENSNLDYKVYLKPNDYFGEYLGKDKQYIASLIDHIEADFRYDLALYEDVDYTYTYFINAIVQVTDENGKPLYQRIDEVVSPKTLNAKQDNTFIIDEKVNLDYNYYNEIIKEFIKKYSLTNTTSTVVLKMYVGIEGDCKEFDTSLSDDAVISMTIPLTTNTVNVDMNYVLTNSTDKLLQCSKKSITDNILFIIGSGLIVLSAMIFIYLIIYLIKTRSIKTIYNHRLRNIFSNYGRYISKIKTPLDFKKYEVIPVDDFEDLIEIRNCSQSPILFINDEEKFESTFIIPTDKIIYIYRLTLEDIKEGDIDE